MASVEDSSAWTMESQAKKTSKRGVSPSPLLADSNFRDPSAALVFHVCSCAHPHAVLRFQMQHHYRSFPKRTIFGTG